MPTAIICIVLIVICVIAVRSYCKKLKNGCCGAGGDAVKRIRPADKEAEHYPYSCRIGIDGMTCKNCALRVENAFHEREGFYAQVHLKEHCAVVYMKTPVPEPELRQIVQRAGYSVTGIQELAVQ